jgi:hypothetical protein
MSTGGIFALITNDGKQDRMLMASELLKTRLEAITAARRGNPTISDPTPTLLDIEKTHIIFTNAHFKPFAAIGFEYNKTTAAAGNSALGSDVTFSIPQFGDFFHDMVLYVKLKQPVLTTTAPSVSDQPLMRWCSYPGERLLEQVEFEVNGNPLDKYSDSNVNFHREFSITKSKLPAWNRCMGQEEAEAGFVDQPSWVGSGVAPSSIVSRIESRSFSGDQTPTGQKDVSVFKELLIPLLFWCNKDVRLSVPSVAIPYGQRFIKVKLATGDKLVNLVPRGAGGFSDATIGGSLNYDNMLKTIELYINNIFVNPEVHNIFIKRIGFTLIRVHRQQTLNADQSTAEVLLQQLKWPIETLMVGMKIKDYNSTDVTLRRTHLDKWHTFSQITPTTRSAQGWRSAKTTVKNAAYVLPASALNCGAAAPAQLRLTPSASLSAGSNSFEGVSPGDILTVVVPVPGTLLTVTLVSEVAKVQPDADSSTKGYLEFKQSVASAVALFTAASPSFAAASVPVAAGTTALLQTTQSTETTSTVSVPTKTVDTITIKAHGIPIYNGFVTKFYNAYLPYHYGGPNVSAPQDSGALLIPFNLYPGTYQPSGHINVSRAREFYIEYTSSVISTANVGTLVVTASAINFLLISDGSAVLRYST